MLIDDIIIKVKAGDGGDGCVAFDKNMMALGPTGASGGRGGFVYLEGVSDLGALRSFKNRKDWKAESGEKGRGQWKDGARGDDLILKVPVGTVVSRIDEGSETPFMLGEISHIGERMCIAEGGRGGRGNFHFKGPTNTSPKEFEFGKPGDEASIHLELKLIADVGFIGLPNVGKSSLLNELTNANAKVANYRFTTLEPNLGVFYDLILADIPGLIEGAAEGKGLGIKFLKHVERTKILFHLIAADSEDPKADYQTVRAELGKYNEALLEKPEYIFMSRSDEVSPEILKEKIKALKSLKKPITPISILDDESLKKVKATLSKIAEEKRAAKIEEEAEKIKEAEGESEKYVIFD